MSQAPTQTLLDQDTLDRIKRRGATAPGPNVAAPNLTGVPAYTPQMTADRYHIDAQRNAMAIHALGGVGANPNNPQVQSLLTTRRVIDDAGNGNPSAAAYLKDEQTRAMALHSAAGREQLAGSGATISGSNLTTAQNTANTALVGPIAETERLRQLRLQGQETATTGMIPAQTAYDTSKLGAGTAANQGLITNAPAQTAANAALIEKERLGAVREGMVAQAGSTPENIQSAVQLPLKRSQAEIADLEAKTAASKGETARTQAGTQAFVGTPGAPGYGASQALKTQLTNEADADRATQLAAEQLYGKTSDMEAAAGDPLAKIRSRFVPSAYLRDVTGFGPITNTPGVVRQHATGNIENDIADIDRLDRDSVSNLETSAMLDPKRAAKSARNLLDQMPLPATGTDEYQSGNNDPNFKVYAQKLTNIRTRLKALASPGKR